MDDLGNHGKCPLHCTPYVQVFSTQSQTIPPASAIAFEKCINICGFKRISISTLEALEGGTYLWNYYLLTTYPISVATESITYGLKINKELPPQTFFGQGFSTILIPQEMPIVPSGTIYIPYGAKISLVNISTNTGLISNALISTKVNTASLTLEKISE
jgi:hypothetical protein